MLDILIVGSSGYAGYLLERLWELADLCRIAGVCELPGVENKSLARCRLNQIPVFRDLEHMLSEGNAQVVLIATGIASHAAITEKCLRAGYDVLLEKPPVATVQELDHLVNLSQQTGQRIGVNFQHLLGSVPCIIQRQLIANNYGAPLRIRSIGAWPRPLSYFQRNRWSGKLRYQNNWVLDGSLNNPFAHLLAQNLFFASPLEGKLAQPETVTAELYHANPIEAEDTSSLRLLTTDGVEIVQSITLNATEVIEPTTIIETEGTHIKVYGFHRYEVHEKKDKQRPGITGIKGDTPDNEEDRRHMLRVFFECIQEDKDFPVTLETCKPFVLAVNAAFDSSGPPASIPPKHIEWINTDGESQAVVAELIPAMGKAFDAGLILSDTGLPWAYSGTPVDVDNYAHFPSNERWQEWLQVCEATHVSRQSEILQS